MDILDSLFAWFAAATVRGSLLVLLVLILQAGLRRVISPQWRYALWLPVLLVLVAPHLPQSRWSAENLRNSALESWHRAVTPAPSLLPVLPSTTTSLAGAALKDALAPLEVINVPVTSVNTPPKRSLEWRRIAAVAWILGATAVVVISLLAYARARRRIVQDSVPPSRVILDMLQEATKACGLRKAPRLIVSRAVGSPAVTGLLRPTLLLPAGFPSELSEEEAPLVLRHELLHLKRWDLPVNWLLCCIQAVHWCNPIAWLVAHRIRADREAACDAQVLELASGDSRAAYGYALLKMEGTMASSGWTLGFVGIFEREAEMRTRIRAIASYRRAQPATSLVAAALLAALTLAGATRAQENGLRADAPPPPATPSSATGGDVAVVKGKFAAMEKVRRKLGAIIIPRIDFRNATVREALEFLEKRSVELDPSGAEPAQRGVKIMLKPEPQTAPGPQATVGQGKPDEARLTLSLKDISLADALRYVTGLTNLKYQVKSEGVELVSQISQSLITKEWVLPAEAGFTAGDDAKALLLAEGIPFPQGTTASLSPDGKRLTVNNTSENLDLIDELVERAGSTETPYDEMRRKLRTLIIPRLELKEATLVEAVNLLKAKSIELDRGEKDPSQRGVNIVIKAQSTQPGLPPGIPGREPVAIDAGAELDSKGPRLTLSLSDIPLGEALRYVANLSDHTLSVEPFIVALIKKVEPNGRLMTKEFKLNEAMIAALALKDREVGGELRGRGISFPRGTSAVWLRSSRKLVMRNTQENHDLLDDVLASLAGEPVANAEQTRAESLIIPTLTFEGATLREAVEVIRVRSAAADPAKKGVNVALDIPPALQQTKITLALTNTSVWDALRHIARIAEVKLGGEAQTIRIHSSTTSKVEQ